METKKLICINCPMGCALEVGNENGEYVVSGNTCKRGIEYGIAEVTNPMRAITTSVFVNDGVHPTVCVKTNSDIPKKLVFDCIKELSGIRVEAPVKIGDVIIRNILNTGADIVATRNVEKL